MPNEKKPNGGQIKADRRARILHLRKQGLTIAVISQRLGVSRCSVNNMLKRMRNEGIETYGRN